MAPLLLLEGEKLQKLARIIRNQEVEAINNLSFKSEEERAKYLRDVRDNYNSVIKLLDDADATKQTYKDDETRSSVAKQTFSYVLKGVNISLQAVRNYNLRTSYLAKISAHSKDIIDTIEKLDPKDVEAVANLAKEAKQYDDYMLDIMMKHQSSASRNFSKWLKESGTKFEDLVARYKSKRGFSGPFENLEAEEKLLVYNDIIEASGRGGLTINALSTASGAAGVLFLILATGTMVWDIFTAEHSLDTATKDAMMTAASSIGGALVEEVIEAASTTLIGLEASSLFVTGTAIIGGFVGAFIIGAFVGWFIDLILGNGGSYPHSTDNHQCYVAPLPDGEAVARQIAHSDD